MSDNEIIIPESLKKALEANEIVPFIGAGVSKAIEKTDGSLLFPTWKEFLLKGADKLDKENKSSEATTVRSLLEGAHPDYLEAAQHTCDFLGQKHWYDLLKESFEIDLGSANERSLELAKLIWQLGSSLVVTTNIDLVLQSANDSPQKVKIIDIQSAELAELQRNWKPSRPTVLHLHGHIDNKSEVIFTRGQYQAFYNLDKNRAKLETLRNLFTQRTILFIGFSLDDLFILRELERVNVIYDGAANLFYAVVRESERSNANIPPYVEKITFQRFGENLVQLVKQLSTVSKVGQGKTALSDSGNELNGDRDHKIQASKQFSNIPFSSKENEFVGRTGKLQEIWDSLSIRGRTAIGQAINIKGIGGLGKTQLAVEYAQKYRDRYPNGIFWLTADEDINIQLIKIAQQLSWIPKEGGDSALQAEDARNKFREISNALVIFDNVDSQKTIKNYLPKPSGKPHILITSREEQDGFQQINLDVLSRSEARDLLLRISARNPTDEQEKLSVEKILDELGNLPLAIELVGGYLGRREKISFQKFYEYLEYESLDKLETIFPNNSLTEHDKSIIRTLKISEQLLQHTPYLEDILDILAWSGKSSMSISLLRSLVEANNDIGFDEAVGMAESLRLIKKDDESERYSIHRLLAKVRRFEKPIQQRAAWLERKADILKGWFGKDNKKSHNSIETETDLEHLYEWQNHIDKYLILDPVKSKQSSKGGSANTINVQGDGNTIIQGISNSEIRISTLYDDLGSIYGELGNYEEALNYLNQALTSTKKLEGTDTANTANILSEIGNIYSELNDYQKALTYHLEALEIRQKLFGDHNPEIANSLNNVGIAYGNLAHYQQALQYQLEALTIRQKLFGQGHPDVALSLDDIGRTYGSLGDSMKAVENLESALSMLIDSLGRKHPNTIRTCVNLITELIKSGLIEKAHQLAAEFLRFVPTNHPKRKFLEYYGASYFKLQQKKRSKLKKKK